MLALLECTFKLNYYYQCIDILVTYIAEVFCSNIKSCIHISLLFENWFSHLPCPLHCTQNKDREFTGAVILHALHGTMNCLEISQGSLRSLFCPSLS